MTTPKPPSAPAPPPPDWLTAQAQAAKTAKPTHPWRHKGLVRGRKP